MEIRDTNENSVPSGSSCHFMGHDRLRGLIVIMVGIFPGFSQKKMWVKIQYQMEVLNQIYIAPNIIALTKVEILNNFALPNET